MSDDVQAFVESHVRHYWPEDASRIMDRAECCSYIVQAINAWQAQEEWAL